jgi:hypothetical protein
MRKAIFVVAVSALAVAPALADFGDIIRTWNAPKVSSKNGFCRGLAWDGDYIWCSVDYTNPREYFMFRCRPLDGSVVSSFKTAFHNYLSSGGMCYRQWGGRPCLELTAWDLPKEEAFLYRYYANGSLANVTPVKVPGNQNVWGVFYDGRNDWVCDFEEAGSKVYKLGAGGTPISSFTINKPGLAWGFTKQADFFWFTVSGAYCGAYKSRENGSVVASFEAYGTPSDCTYERKRLWISVGCTVFCYDVSNAPAVAPASAGRVKALFR